MKKLLITILALWPMVGCDETATTTDTTPPPVVIPQPVPVPMSDAGVPIVDAAPDATAVPDAAVPDAAVEPPTLVGEWVVVRTVRLLTCCGKCGGVDFGDRDTTEWVCDEFAGDILCRAQGDTAYETLTFDAGLAGLAEESGGGVLEVTVTLADDGESFTGDEEITTASGECTVWRDVEGWRK